MRFYITMIIFNLYIFKMDKQLGELIGGNIKQNNDNNIDNEDNSSNSAGDDSKEYDQNPFYNKSLFLKSQWEDGNSVFYMQYDFAICKDKKDISRAKEVEWKPKSKKYRIYYSAYKNTPECITIPFKINGAIRSRSIQKANVIWKLLKLEKMIILLGKLNKYQRFNHFLCTWDLGRKDNMYNNYIKIKEIFSEDFNYIPETFILPRDFEIMIKKTKSESEKDQKWILKPVASSRGRGIRLVNNLETIPSRCLISRYISSPHLINNKKYDLRLYVLITSFTPLKIYLYNEGLVRFASEEYNLEDKNKHNKYMHLTNYSINKSSQNFDKNMSTENECCGSKWSLSAYRAYLMKNNLNYEKIESQIKDIIIKSVMTVGDENISAIKKYCKHPNVLFELYGFDILIDNELRPWLIEINLNASLNCDSELDKKIKTSLMTDIFTIIGLTPYSHLNDNKLPKKGKEKKTPRCMDDKNKANLDINNEIETKYDFCKEPTVNKIKNENNIQNNSFDVIEINENLINTIDKNNSYDKDEIEMIKYAEDEFVRSGGFKLIFPIKENVNYYSKFILMPEKENLCMWKWINNRNYDYLYQKNI